jgi:hypothetical protein
LRTAVDAIERLEADGRSDTQLIVIDEGVQKQELIEHLDQHSIKNVVLAPTQPVEMFTDVFNCGDASLVDIMETVKRMCVSSKFYSSLVIGDPVLVIFPRVTKSPTSSPRPNVESMLNLGRLNGLVSTRTVG